MTVDFHTHVFPEKLAARALQQLSDKSGGLRPLFDGTPEGLANHMKSRGVDLAVVLSIATNANQQRSVNDFAIAINNGQYPLIAFGSVFPSAPDAADEIDRLARAGIKGVKFHPEYQGFFVDDEWMFPIYERIASLGMITVFHAGADIGFPKPIHSSPKRIARALPHFGGAPVVAAHFGGYISWDEVEEHLVGRDVYFDTSFCFGRIPFPQAERIASMHGAGRLLFGSDLPWSDEIDELGLIERLHLSDGELRQILSGNALRLLNL